MNKHYVNSCLRWLANELVPYYNNQGLPASLMLRVDTFYRSISDAIDWFSLTKKDAQTLGFMNWDEDDEENGVWFIPAWLFHAIPDGLVLVDKNGSSFTFHTDDAPRDTMYGCLTFGVRFVANEVDNGNY